MKKYFSFLVCGLILFPAVLFAKEGADTLDLHETILYKNVGSSKAIGLSTFNESKAKKSFFKSIRFNGWARMYLFHRDMKNYYDVAPSQGLSLPVNLTLGDGYQQPLMLFRMEANPSAKTYFQTELQFDHRLLTLATSPVPSDTLGRLASLYVLFKLEGSVDTRMGKFRVISGGGSNWYRLSPATFWGYQYRDDLFERYPWDPEGHDFARYSSSYAVGDIPRDQRFGMQATQGFALEGTNMPSGFDAALLYGKTTTSGGFQSYVTKNPQNFFATRIGKKLGDHKIGYNYYNQFGYTSNQINYKPVKVEGTDTFYVQDNYISQLITTVDGRFEFKHFSIFTEAGMGSYLSNIYNDSLKKDIKPGIGNISRYKRNWGETVFFEITTKKRLTLIPLKLGYYRINRHVVNNNSSVANTSVEQDKPNPAVPDEYYINYYDGMVTDIGQLANNRQGFNLTGNKDFKKLKTKLSLGIAQELVNLAGDTRNGARANLFGGTGADSLTQVPFSNSISFEHRINGLTRSRFDFSKRFSGPYHRTHSVFRRTYDNIAITDTLVDYKKSFSSAQLELKYKFNLFGKELLLTNFNNLSSVQDYWSPIPVVTDKAFLRYFYEEFMFFYAIHPKITFIGFVALEKVKGNSRTELADANGELITDANGRPVADPNGKPIDQTGYGFGPGIDYNFHSQASLNIRQRWFSHSDKNFTLDKFKGNEMTIEFKVFF